ncbi:hypothetical protein BB559_004619 [Furculomyces boomerangus]|uniref:cAMP-independent regulatory protein pac2 n=2 Tax=Furculomyces boomerangus TaxID=61424 RepID=A0A2T9YDS2_9FUNG|nr:hypothetical protein BB559_004619 [Furculomyces boomerangus]
METYYGYIDTIEDSLFVFEACRLGKIPKISKRLSESDRKKIRSGSVFVWDETKSSIKRWTDGINWSASRVAGPFLAYVEWSEPRRATKKHNPHNNTEISSFPNNTAPNISPPIPPSSKSTFFTELSPSLYINSPNAEFGFNNNTSLTHHIKPYNHDFRYNNTGYGSRQRVLSTPMSTKTHIISNLSGYQRSNEITHRKYKKKPENSKSTNGFEIPGGMKKKTFRVETTSGEIFRIVSYFYEKDVIDIKLKRPSTDPDFPVKIIEPGIFPKTFKDATKKDRDSSDSEENSDGMLTPIPTTSKKHKLILEPFTQHQISSPSIRNNNLNNTYYSYNNMNQNDFYNQTNSNITNPQQEHHVWRLSDKSFHQNIPSYKKSTHSIHIQGIQEIERFSQNSFHDHTPGLGFRYSESTGPEKYQKRTTRNVSEFRREFESIRIFSDTSGINHPGGKLANLKNNFDETSQKFPTTPPISAFGVEPNTQYRRANSFREISSTNTANYTSNTYYQPQDSVPIKRKVPNLGIGVSYRMHNRYPPMNDKLNSKYPYVESDDINFQGPPLGSPPVSSSLAAIMNEECEEYPTEVNKNSGNWNELDNKGKRNSSNHRNNDYFSHRNISGYKKDTNYRMNINNNDRLYYPQNPTNSNSYRAYSSPLQEEFLNRSIYNREFYAGMSHHKDNHTRSHQNSRDLGHREYIVDSPEVIKNSQNESNPIYRINSSGRWYDNGSGLKHETQEQKAIEANFSETKNSDETKNISRSSLRNLISPGPYADFGGFEDKRRSYFDSYKEGYENQSPQIPSGSSPKHKTFDYGTSSSSAFQAHTYRPYSRVMSPRLDVDVSCQRRRSYVELPKPAFRSLSYNFGKSSSGGSDLPSPLLLLRGGEDESSKIVRNSTVNNNEKEEFIESQTDSNKG